MWKGTLRRYETRAGDTSPSSEQLGRRLRRRAPLGTGIATTRVLSNARLPALRCLACRGAPLDAALRRAFCVGAAAGDEPALPTRGLCRAGLRASLTRFGIATQLHHALRHLAGTFDVCAVILRRQ